MRVCISRVLHITFGLCGTFFGAQLGALTEINYGVYAGVFIGNLMTSLSAGIISRKFLEKKPLTVLIASQFNANEL